MKWFVIVLALNGQPWKHAGPIEGWEQCQAKKLEVMVRLAERLSEDEVEALRGLTATCIEVTTYQM